jgi:hypothetical protein
MIAVGRMTLFLKRAKFGLAILPAASAPDLDPRP